MAFIAIQPVESYETPLPRPNLNPDLPAAEDQGADAAVDDVDAAVTDEIPQACADGHTDPVSDKGSVEGKDHIGAGSDTTGLVLDERSPVEVVGGTRAEDVLLGSNVEAERESGPKSVLHWFAAIAGLCFVQNGLMASILIYAAPQHFFLNSVIPGLLTPLSAMLAYKVTCKRLIFACCGVTMLMAVATVVLALVRGIKDTDSAPITHWWDYALYTPLVFLGANSLTYSKAAILARLPSDALWSATDDLMKRAGVSMQIGSFVGAFTFFLVVHT